MEPILIKGVDAQHAGTPSNDGTPGSGLYAVPIKLSRAVTPSEAKLLEQNWDHPPVFTLMHRPGILRVSGDTVVLDGTTIEEVKQYHAETLKCVVEVVNVQAGQLVEQHQAKIKAEAEAATAHKANIADVAKDIRFN